MCDPDLKSRSILNPNYADVKCIQPMPGMIKIRGRTNHEDVVPVQNHQGPSYGMKRFIVADGNPQHNKGISHNHGDYRQQGGMSNQGRSHVENPWPEKNLKNHPDVYHEGNPQHHPGDSQYGVGNSQVEKPLYDFAADYAPNHNYYDPANDADDSSHSIRLVNSFSSHNHKGMYENVEVNSNHNANNQQDPEIEIISTESRDQKRDEKEEKLLQDHHEAEADGTDKKSGPLTWREHLKHFLHSRPCHIAVIVLVLIDSVLVITEILLDLELIEVGEESEAPEIVHYCSISILSIFMLEITAKIVADWHHFRTHKIEILDAIVVVVAFAFDISMLFIHNDALVAVGLLVLLRLWRIVRLVNGIILTVKNEADERVHELKAKLQKMEEELEEEKEKVKKQEEEIKKLREILTQNGIHIEAEEDCEQQDGSMEPRNGAILKLNDAENIISIDT